MAPVDVLVIGRANVDLTLSVPSIPERGRNVFSTGLTITAGGKGLNQAIAVTQLGGRSALIGNVGDDPWGQMLAATLADAGVDLSTFRLLPDTQTGAAIVQVTPDGENYITVAVSAPTELTSTDIDNALSVVRAPVTIVQLDLPPDPVMALLSARLKTMQIGNLVPDPGLDPASLDALDVFVVNEHEAAAVLDRKPGDPQGAAEQLRRLGPSAAVVTAAERGAAYAGPDGSGTVPAVPVTPVDTTGAGDAFLGALALHLARGHDLTQAVVAAVHAGTAAVQHHGAQSPLEANARHARDQ